ncbi:Bax inhibitor-1/YccA family protein [Streptomyces chrestomyceticus]|uniref:Bax inhibitor-1/YccA family membrane protein n=1 Tax=Streptomyces chrestomyceticus TaxID=68185 RepID=UPI0036BC5594
MRGTSNPAIRNLLGPGSCLVLAGPAPSAVRGRAAVGRPVTKDDIVVRTGLSLATVVASGCLSGFFRWTALAWAALPVALGIALYLTLRPRPSAVLTLLYSAAEGVLLGGLTRAFEQDHPGIALHAVLGTAGVFAGMLVVFKTGRFRLQRTWARWTIATGLGLLALLLVELLVRVAFGVDPGLRGGGAAALAFSALSIAAACLSFLLTFDEIDRLLLSGAPCEWAWYLAFGLVLNLVWLYAELLWLAVRFR